ncbi:MAG: serine hydrolase [Patescibacteria group bacterium]|nr:serine hydrolase [Patescibacteria group bacterium]
MKIFFITFFVSLPFWWGVNVFEKNLEDFLFWQEIADNPQILTAQIDLEKKLESLKPIRDWRTKDLEIEAKSAISVLITKEGEEKILFEKESSKILPIASLTKLMTANIVLKYYDLSKEIKISQEAVEQEEDFGKLKAGKIFSIKYLLYPLLMESSNDAAYALAEVIGQEAFVDLMNLEAKSLGLKNTHFFNSTGLDPKNLANPLNCSTAEDLVKLAKYLLEEQPLIWEILSTPKFTLYGPELINNNKLLGEISGIVGGKTGYTEKALHCFLLVIEAPKNQGEIINIVLGAENHFKEMKKIINWINQAYRW